MTICFKDYPAMKKFMANLFTGNHSDNTFPIFAKDFTTSFCYRQVSFPNLHETEEMEEWLKSKKIAYNWVCQF